MADYKQMEWTGERVAKFWNYISNFPELYFTYKCGDLVVAKTKKYLKRGSNVLDYGCGTGFLIPHLLKSGANVMGLDFSEESIRSVNDRFTGEGNFKGAFTKEQLIEKHAHFDVIFLLEVIEHLNDKYLEEVFNDLKYFLKKDGVCIITTPNDEKLEDNYIFCPQCEHVFHKWQHMSSWDKNKLRTYVENRGLKIVELYKAYFEASFKKDKFLFMKHVVKKILGKASSKLVCVCKL